jgi:putative phosphoribosyl transferase
MTSRPYPDRTAAGEVLAVEVVAAVDAAERDHDRDLGQPLVLALPRGGVPVAVPVAQALGVSTAVLVVRKLGAPGQPELAVGAIAAIGDRVEQVLNAGWAGRLGLSEHDLARLVASETEALRARVAAFGSAPPVDGRMVIVVDDGLATGATMRAAVTAVRGAGAEVVMAAAPVGAAGACHELERLADYVICPRRPEPFRAVGEHYRDFDQLEDAEVLALLA